LKSLQDALYNWLSIKVVAEARPDDQAAQDTLQLFQKILEEEHRLENIRVEKNELMYSVTFLQNGKEKQMKFPIELIEAMLQQIEQEPEKYVNYPIE
jgi:hypothetical protein